MLVAFRVFKLELKKVGLEFAKSKLVWFECKIIVSHKPMKIHQIIFKGFVIKKSSFTFLSNKS